MLQLGDGSAIERDSDNERRTPVAVVGLSSGVAMVALGYVRFFCDQCAAAVCVRVAVADTIDCVFVFCEG